MAMTAWYFHVLLFSMFNILNGRFQLESRIVNGIATTTTEWPWIISLRLNAIMQDGSIINEHFCGGSIIRRSKPAAILTAAHCVDWLDKYKHKKEPNIWIDVGRDVVSSDNMTLYSSYKMSTYVYHPNVSYDAYYANTVINDVGVVFIEHELPSTQEIIALNKDSEWLQAGDMFVVIGYGWDDWQSEVYTETLEQTHVMFVNHTQCNIGIDKYFRENWSVTNYTLFLAAIGITYGEDGAYPYDILQCQECIICAIGEDSDACNGDSGSPLIKYNNNEDAIQIGVVSFGFECNVKGIPAQYTDIANYYEWIQQELINSLHSSDNAISHKFVISFIVVVLIIFN